MSEEIEDLEPIDEKHAIADDFETMIHDHASDGTMPVTTYLPGMYKNWFLDYASYVILERAVPEVVDGLKPVQRRILHSMFELEDGRYNKVANIIGNTMKYHPHGDASIGDAAIQMGQRELLIDTQGNWGNILTGDSAAAPRYIEARLSKFALEVAFNPKTTRWKLSYDGRNKEPLTLPMKFPILLASGVEGIAVGLASKLLPHNFIELIDASIAILKGEEFVIYPDFPTGGMADISRYNDGIRGGRVRIRARINQLDKKTLVITEIPFGTTTSGLIDSIIAANDKGKIKIRKIDDNTAQNVEILIHLQPNVSPDQAIDALYAFTDCERSESPNACVIYNAKPAFIGVSEVLKICTRQTLELIKVEQLIRQQELMELLLFASLEKIFIENRIYRDIEEAKTWEAVIKTIHKGLEPYKAQFYREITDDDVVKLTEIKIKRISKFNAFKADEIIKNLNKELKEVKHNLAHIVPFAVDFFEEIKRKYASGRERKTELRSFETIEAAAVAATTQKLYVNREEGFVGYGMKKDEYVCDCSDIDDIIVFRNDGKYSVAKISEKAFVGKNIIHVDVFKKNDTRTTYNAVYQDGKFGATYVKRFYVSGIVRDREYALTKGTPNSQILYFTANPNGESEIIKVSLKAKPRLKKLNFDFDFSELAVKGRSSQGNVLTKNAIRKIVLAEKGNSTLGARKIWYDESVKRLNAEQRGTYLGSFKDNDKIISITASGYYKLQGFDLATHFEEDAVHIEKYNPQKPLTAIYYNQTKKQYFIKRFLTELTDKKNAIIPEDDNMQFVTFSNHHRPILKINFANNNETEEIIADQFIELMGIKAKGKRLTNKEVESIEWLESLPYEADEQTNEDENPNLENILLPSEQDNVSERLLSKPENPEDEETVQMTLF